MGSPYEMKLEKVINFKTSKEIYDQIRSYAKIGYHSMNIEVHLLVTEALEMRKNKK